jgi:phosphoribosylglycinamide formyltransferase-1
MKNIAIFASGSGTNAQRIAEYFRDRNDIQISRIYCNNKQAFVLERAKSLNIPATLITKQIFYETNDILAKLLSDETDMIVLAGFLWLVPDKIISAYNGRIINIHPALLPKYGGKGMYGQRVHEAVIHNGETKSGISIHYVNEEYDDGQIIFQATCPVLPEDTPSSLAARIHDLEYKHYPVVIEKLLKTDEIS